MYAVQPLPLRTPSQKAHSLLILDSDEIFMLKMQKSLQSKGFVVMTATAPEKVSIPSQCIPRLILCDMSLVLQYDTEFFRRLQFKHSRPSTEIIMMSWHCTLYDIRYALKMGAHDCIAKSVSVDTIAMAIEARLQGIAR
jgi:ActR/RegA family two-component response regulator